MVLAFLVSITIATGLSAGEKKVKRVFKETELDGFGLPKTSLEKAAEFNQVPYVPAQFVNNCFSVLNESPEPHGPANSMFAMREFIAILNPSAADARKCGVIKRYFHTIVSHAYNNKLDVITARENVNNDQALVGYIYYGEADRALSLKKWQNIWNLIKQKLFQQEQNRNNRVDEAVKEMRRKAIERAKNEPNKRRVDANGKYKGLRLMGSEY